MVVDALLKANDFLEISSSIEDPSDYWKVQKLFSMFDIYRFFALMYKILC